MTSSGRCKGRFFQSDRHQGCALFGGVVVSAKGKCLQSKCCESCFQSKLFWLKPHPDAHFWVSKVNELLLLHSIWNWGGRVGVGFRIQSHPVLFELLISGNMRGTVRYTPGAQDTANMVSGRVLIRAVHTSLALPLANKPPLLCFFT